MREWSTRPHLVYGRWVTESIKLRRPADESQFTHPLEEEEETVVKEVRRPQLSTTSHTNSKVPLEEDDVLRQYLKPGHTSILASTPSAALSDTQDQQVTRIFLSELAL